MHCPIIFLIYSFKELFNFSEPAVPLTEGRLHGDGRRLLRLVAEAEQVDGLHTEHVALPWDQAMHHKPDTHTFIF